MCNFLGCTQQLQLGVDRVWVDPDCTVQQNMVEMTLCELLGQAFRRWQLLLLVCGILSWSLGNSRRSSTTLLEGPRGEAETTQREQGAS